MVRTYQPGQTVFRSILPEDIGQRPVLASRGSLSQRSAKIARKCPLWVTRRHQRAMRRCPKGARRRTLN
jgi:hypothetical protein